MQSQLGEHYSPSEISEARDEIFKLQENLNKIEELYRNLHSTLHNQQTHFEDIESATTQTEVNIEKGDFDLQQLLQSRTRRDKHQCFIILVISTTACFFLLIVMSVLTNVIRTFGLTRKLAK